jgi:hypothetical protein
MLARARSTQPGARYSRSRPPDRARSVLLVVGILTGCGGGDTLDVTREQLANGATLVRYAALPEEPQVVLEPDLVIGVLEGEPWEMFGDVRGIDADADGNIYVLDFQTRDIRVFDPQGSYLHTLGGPGEGPGELSAANGLAFDADGTLWVNDHGKMRILALETDGSERARVPFPVPAFGFVWEGAMDTDGRIWMASSQRDGPLTMPDEGLNEASSRVYMKSIDPRTEQTDSVYVGVHTGRSFRMRMGQGFSVRGIPHAPNATVRLDPHGGFWRSEGGDYRVARLDEAGDTVLVLEAALPRLAVTDEDRERVVMQIMAQDPDLERPARELASHIPAQKPAIDRLFVDEDERLWVRRVVEADEPPVYDLFDREGEHLNTVALSFSPNPFWGPTVRRNQAYFLVPGEFEVATVVRVPLDGIR